MKLRKSWKRGKVKTKEELQKIIEDARKELQIIKKEEALAEPAGNGKVKTNYRPSECCLNCRFEVDEYIPYNEWEGRHCCNLEETFLPEYNKDDKTDALYKKADKWFKNHTIELEHVCDSHEYSWEKRNDGHIQ